MTRLNPAVVAARVHASREHSLKTRPQGISASSAAALPSAAHHDSRSALARSGRLKNSPLTPMKTGARGLSAASTTP